MFPALIFSQAVSTVAAFGDRWCIASKGKYKTPLSARYLTACSKENYACDGGYMDRAHEFLVENGLVTGGEYDSEVVRKPDYFYPINKNRSHV